MSAPQREHAISAQSTAADTLGDKAARMMDDPFGSIWLGLASTATAVGAVVTGIFGLSVIY